MEVRRKVGCTWPATEPSIYVSFSTRIYGTFPARFGLWGVLLKTHAVRGSPEHSPSYPKPATPVSTTLTHRTVEFINRYCGWTPRVAHPKDVDGVGHALRLPPTRVYIDVRFVFPKTRTNGTFSDRPSRTIDGSHVYSSAGLRPALQDTLHRTLFAQTPVSPALKRHLQILSPGIWDATLVAWKSCS